MEERIKWGRGEGKGGEEKKGGGRGKGGGEKKKGGGEREKEGEGGEKKGGEREKEGGRRGEKKKGPGKQKGEGERVVAYSTCRIVYRLGGGVGGGGGGGGCSPLHFVLPERFSCHLDSLPRARMNWFGVIPASSTGCFETGFLLGLIQILKRAVDKNIIIHVAFTIWATP